MTRETALLILTKYLKNPVLLKHSVYVEAVMRSLAPKFNGDLDMWGITGLLHDADYEKAKGYPGRHGKLLFELVPNSIPAFIEHAIKAHNFEETHVTPESPMDWALYCCDELCGIIQELIQINKDKQLIFPTYEIVVQKLQDKTFAQKAKKEKILLCDEKLGIPLQEFITLTLSAMPTARPLAPPPTS